MSFNVAAATALSTLQQINQGIATATERVSTGNKINSARDNGAYWAVSVKAQSDIGALDAVNDSLSYASGYLSVALGAIEGARSKFEDVRDALLAAGNPTTDFAALKTTVNGLIDEAFGAVEGAKFNDKNLLTLDSADTANVTFLTSLTGTNAAQKLTLATAGLTMTNGTTAGVMDTVADWKGGGTGTIADATEAGTLLALVNTAITNMVTAETKLGSALNRVDSAKDFNTAMKTVKEKAVSELISADMEAESTRLQALQTQQALAIEALSIANTQSASVLQLFR